MTAGDIQEKLRNGWGVRIFAPALAMLLVAVATGTWKMAADFEALQQQVASIDHRMDRRDQQIERRNNEQDEALGRVRARLRYMEQQQFGKEHPGSGT